MSILNLRAPALVLTLLASACGGSDKIGGSGSGNDGPPAPIRVVNGVADSSTLEASFSGESDDTQQVAFGSSSPLISVPGGSYTVDLTPNTTADAFSVNDVLVGQGNLVTVFGAGTQASHTQNGFSVVQSLSPPSSGAIVQVIDAAYVNSQTMTLTVVFQTPGNGDSSGGPSAAPAYGQASAPLDLVSGSYEIVVYGTPLCAANQVCPTNESVLFDSGSTGIPFPSANGANIFQLALLDGSSSGNGIQLLLLDERGDSTLLTPTPLVSSGPAGGARVVNGVADSPSLQADFSGGYGLTPPIAFGSSSPLVTLPGGNYTVDMLPSTAADSFLVSNVSVGEAGLVTVFGGGTQASDTQNGFSVVQSLATPSSGAVVQLINAAYLNSQNFSLTVSFNRPPGAGDTSGNPSASAAYGQAAAPLDLASGAYEIVVYGSPICAPNSACSTLVAILFDSGSGGISFPASNGANIFQLALLDGNSSGNGIQLLLMDELGGSTTLANAQASAAP